MGPPGAGELESGCPGSVLACLRRSATASLHVGGWVVSRLGGLLNVHNEYPEVSLREGAPPRASGKTLFGGLLPGGY